MDVLKKFEMEQLAIRKYKLEMSARRALALQVRAKIKPSEMNPVLLNSPSKSGSGNLELYYPTN